MNENTISKDQDGMVYFGEFKEVDGKIIYETDADEE